MHKDTDEVVNRIYRKQSRSETKKERMKFCSKKYATNEVNLKQINEGLMYNKVMTLKELIKKNQLERTDSTVP